MPQPRTKWHNIHIEWNLNLQKIRSSHGIKGTTQTIVTFYNLEIIRAVL